MGDFKHNSETWHKSGLCQQFGHQPFIRNVKGRVQNPQWNETCFSVVKITWNDAKCCPISVYTISSPCSLSHSNTQEVMSVKSVRAQGLRLSGGHWDWAVVTPKPQLSVVPHRTLIGLNHCVYISWRQARGFARSHDLAFHKERSAKL